MDANDYFMKIDPAGKDLKINLVAVIIQSYWSIFYTKNLIISTVNLTLSEIILTDKYFFNYSTKQTNLSCVSILSQS